MKSADFTDAEYKIIIEFVEAMGVKEFVRLLNYWQGNTESTEDFIYSLAEYMNPFS
jgi:hypothetical protein